MKTLLPSSPSSSPSPTEADGWQPRPDKLGSKFARRLASTARFRLMLAAGVLITVATTALIVQFRPGQAQGSIGLEDGRQLFINNCAQCHGANGDRVPVAPLYSRDFLDSRGDATLLAAITDGKGVMPAWGKSRSGPFDDEQIRAVLAYLNRAAGRTSASVLAGTGRAIFTDQCSRCHGASADRIPVAPLSAKGFLDARTDAQLDSTIRSGQGLMPAFQGLATGAALDDEQIQSVVAYLRFNAEANLAGQARRGRDLYVNSCLACHGERGDHVAGVALASAEDLQRRGDGAITRAISDGKGAMPGLTESGGARVEEVTSVLAYLKVWSGLPAGKALAGPQISAQGAALFTNNCTGCHGDSGDKVPDIRLRAPDFINTRSDDTLVREISQGNTRGMPAFGQANGGPLSDVDIRNVIGFLRVWPVSAVAAAAPPARVPTAPASAPPDTALASRGQVVFDTNCAACHGQTHDSVPQAHLNDSNWLQQRGDAALAQSITRGKGAMPAWGQERGGPLSADDVSAVITYLKTSAAESPAVPTPVPAPAPATAAGQAQTAPAVAASGDGSQTLHGKDLYSTSCMTCHGDTHDKQPTAKLNDSAWLQQRGDDALRQSIARGKPPMPAWGKESGGPLGQDDINAILAYLKSTAH